jgi:hypothetical protein
MDFSLCKCERTRADLFRGVGALCAAIIVIGWIALATIEAFARDDWIPYSCSYRQALVLAVIFAAYLIGWHHELLGAALAILGTVAFFVVGHVDVEKIPPLPAAWLAMPGLLYLFAWLFGRRGRSEPRFSDAARSTDRIVP